MFRGVEPRLSVVFMALIPGWLKRMPLRATSAASRLIRLEPVAAHPSAKRDGEAADFREEIGIKLECDDPVITQMPSAFAKIPSPPTIVSKIVKHRA